jgi:hypothetical protein
LLRPPDFLRRLHFTSILPPSGCPTTITFLEAGTSIYRLCENNSPADI